MSKKTQHTQVWNCFWLFALTLLTAGLPAAATPAVFGERASVKVRPSYSAREDAGVKLVAARNEFASFQVVIHGGSAGGKVLSAQVSDFKGPSTIGQDRVVVYRQAFLNIATSSGKVGEKGLWPDGLIPDVDEMAKEKRNAFPFDVPAEQARALWVDVHVPPNAAPGDYDGQVTVTGEGFSAQVPVHLVVMKATLPSTSSLASAFLIFSGNACQALTGSSDCGGTQATSEQLLRFETLALDHRITLPNVFMVGQNGDNWAGFDDAYAPYLNGHAPTRLPGARMTSAQITASRNNIDDYKSWAQHFRDKGWMDRLYDYTGDEPPYGLTFAEAKNRLVAVRAADPLIRTLLTTSITAAEDNGLTSLIDVMVPVINYLDGMAPYLGNQRSKYDAFVKDGNQLWSYQSCMSQGCGYGTTLPENTPGSGWPSYMVDRSAAKNRAMQWLLYKYGVSGELYYETALLLNTAWTNQFGYSGNGDGTLFYPGTPSAIGGKTAVPLPSLRMKHIRQGMQDYEWLKLVADAGDPQFAQQVVDSLLPTAHNVPDDGEAFDDARLKLIHRYAELTGDSASALRETASSGGASSSTSAGAGCSSTGAALFPMAGLFGLWALLQKRIQRTRALERVKS